MCLVGREREEDPLKLAHVRAINRNWRVKRLQGLGGC